MDEFQSPTKEEQVMKTLLLLVAVMLWVVSASGCRWWDEWWHGRREVVIPAPTQPVMHGAPTIGSPCGAVSMGTTCYSP